MRRATRRPAARRRRAPARDELRRAPGRDSRRRSSSRATSTSRSRESRRSSELTSRTGGALLGRRARRVDHVLVRGRLCAPPPSPCAVAGRAAQLGGRSSRTTPPVEVEVPEPAPPQPAPVEPAVEEPRLPTLAETLSAPCRSRQPEAACPAAAGRADACDRSEPLPTPVEPLPVEPPPVPVEPQPAPVETTASSRYAASAAVRSPSSARDRLERRDHVRDVLVELEPEQLRARVDLVAVDPGGERRLLQLLAHRLRLEAVEPGRADEPARVDEPRQLVAGEQRPLERRVARASRGARRARAPPRSRPPGSPPRAGSARRPADACRASGGSRSRSRAAARSRARAPRPRRSAGRRTRSTPRPPARGAAAPRSSCSS